jgi:CRP-like cAMP-binding protein
MDLHNLLQDVELFNGLTEKELADISRVCQERLIKSGETITEQGGPGDEMYIITEGFVQVSIGSGPKERILVNWVPGRSLARWLW